MKWKFLALIWGLSKIAYWGCKNWLYMKWNFLALIWGLSKLAYWRSKKHRLYMKWNLFALNWGLSNFMLREYHCSCLGFFRKL